MLENAFDAGAPSAGAWWYVIPPGLCITLLVLAVAMLGYLFEEYVNPRLRERALSALLEVADLLVHHGGGRSSTASTLSLRRGEALGLAGESGCGKTTTALAVMRLLPAGARAVGRDQAAAAGEEPINIHRRTERGMQLVRWRHVSLVFQGAMNSLDPVQRVDAPDRRGDPAARAAGGGALRERVAELLETVGLTPALGSRYAHQLSGGQRQRVMIALALACRPVLVIADEPTTALDVVMQAQILELLERLREELGLALILISHDLGVLAETCDRIAVMYAGRIVEAGPVDAVFASPQHPYTQRLLDVAAGDRRRARAGADPIPGGPPEPGEARGCRVPAALPATRPRSAWRSRRCARSRPASPPLPLRAVDRRGRPPDVASRRPARALPRRARGAVPRAPSTA